MSEWIFLSVVQHAPVCIRIMDFTHGQLKVLVTNQHLGSEHGGGGVGGGGVCTQYFTFYRVIHHFFQYV